MKRTSLSIAGAVALASALAACGGGGGSSSLPPLANGTATPIGTASPSATATPTAAPAATPTPTAAPSNASSVVVRIVIPRAKHGAAKSREPNFVSPNSTQFSSTINTVNGSAMLPTGVARTTVVTFNTGAGGNCVVTANGESCTVTVPAPAGTDNFTFSLLDSSGDVLSTETGAFPIVPGTANTLSVTLLGVVASVTVGNETLTAGTTASDTLGVSAFDASGAAISGTFSTPVTLTDGDTSGASSLATNGGTTGTTASFSASTDSVVLAYDGTAIASFDITAAPLAVTGGAITVMKLAISLSGTTTDSGSMADPNYGDPTLFFVSVPQTESVTASETGYIGTFSVDTTACGSGAAAIVSEATSDSLTFAFTSANAGLCKIVVSDSFGQSASFYASVNTGSVGIDGRRR